MVHGILSYRGRKLGPGVLESTSEGCSDTVNNMSIHIFCMEGSGWLFGLDLGGGGGGGARNSQLQGKDSVAGGTRIYVWGGAQTL